MTNPLQSVWQRRPKVTPTFKMTAAYLSILMVVSLALTIQLYRVSTAASDQGLRRERLYFEGVTPFGIGPSYQSIEQGQASALHITLRNQLIGLNLIILVLGGGLSYYLARRTLRPIEASLRAQTRFAADASHELRTPLTAMKSEIEVALRDPKLPADDARELLGSNLEEVAKLEALASGLLRLARHENEPLPVTNVDLKLVVERATQRLALAASRRKVELTTDTVTGHAKGDLDSLVELAVVLIDNAIKYSPAGSTVAISTKPHSGHVNLIVHDDGVGIAAPDLPHIFERFYRADTSRSKTTPGYGLGLSIAARIADLHKGSIDATSRAGHGSTFTVHLPSAG